MKPHRVPRPSLASPCDNVRPTPFVKERRRTFRALVVEDDQAILTLVRRVLEREGFSVEGVKSGDEAIQVLKTISYDLLILDLVLPGVTGEDVMTFLEEAQPRTLRRIVVMTASPRRLSCEFLERICRILTKPFDVEELVLIARECVRDSGLSSPTGE